MYLSVPSLDPVVRVFFLHLQSGAAGPSRGGHVGRIAASVASPPLLPRFIPSVNAAAGKRHQLQNQRKEKKKTRRISTKTHRRRARCLSCSPGETRCRR